MVRTFEHNYFWCALNSDIYGNKLPVISTVDTLLKNRAFVDVFLTEGYEYSVLRKELLIITFVERIETITMGRVY